MGFINGIKKAFYGRVAKTETVENLGASISVIVTLHALANRQDYHEIHGIKAAAIYDELIARGGEKLVKDVYDIAIKEGNENVERVKNGLPVSISTAAYSILEQYNTVDKSHQRATTALSGGGFMETVMNAIGSAARDQKIADEFLLYMSPSQKKQAMHNFARRLSVQGSSVSETLYDRVFKDDETKNISVVGPGVVGIAYAVYGSVISQPAFTDAGGLLAAGTIGMIALHSIKSIQKSRKEIYLDDLLTGTKNPYPPMFFRKFPAGNMAGIVSIMEVMTPDQLASARQRYPDLPVAETEKTDYVTEQVDIHNMAVSEGKPHEMAPGMGRLYAG